MTFTRARKLAGYRARFVAPLGVVTDETLEMYRAFGFERGAWWRVWGLRSMRRYAELVRAGRRDIAVDGDTLQLGGDVVIDRAGRVAYVFHGAGPDERPSVDELLDVIRRC